MRKTKSKPVESHTFAGMASAVAHQAEAAEGFASVLW